MKVEHLGPTTLMQDAIENKFEAPSRAVDSYLGSVNFLALRGGYPHPIEAALHRRSGVRQRDRSVHAKRTYGNHRDPWT